MQAPILLLGGTTEGRELAAALAQAGIPSVSSLAGRVANPRLPDGEVRVGGFGGVDGLVDYLRAEQVAGVVDATHPFAARMSDHAARACAEAGVPVLGLLRPGWRESPGDRWTRVPSLTDAATVLPSLGHRCLLTTGRQEVSAFAGVDDVWFLVRAIDPPDVLPPHAELLLARGPFAVDDEERLLADRRIDVVVTKDSGGAMTQAKLVAARRRGVPVVVVDRPPYPHADVVATPAEALAWVRALVGEPPAARRLS